MFRRLAARPLLLAVVAFAAGAAVVSAVWGVSAAVSGGDGDRGVDGVSSQAPAADDGNDDRSDSDSDDDGDGDDGAEPAGPLPVLESTADPVDCPAGDVIVSDADGLQAALDAARPGQVIRLDPGHYVGEFVATASGTAGSRITLCGSAASILDGDSVTGGYVFHLDGAKYWRLAGFAVTNGQKGVMADGTVGSTIEGLTVTRIGDEAIHLRDFSTDNEVLRNDISVTGLRRDKFGEGVYVGTAQSNWCTISDCQPDESDRNLVEGNRIHQTSSEAVDIKEGTSGGVVRGNTFDGSAITGADSWVDVKGRGWLIEGNSGVDSPLDGYQTHEIVDGMGTDNVFRDNRAEVNGPGFGYSLTPERDNVVECSNTATGAGSGVSNVDCRR